MKKIVCFLLLTVALATVSINAGAQGAIWGMTSEGGAAGGGVIFKTNHEGSNYTIVKEFVVDVPGNNPYYCQMVLGPGSLNNTFYGTTRSGGSWGDGIIFRFDPVGLTYTKLIDFRAPTTGSAPLGSLVLYNNKFYGMTSAGGTYNNGTIFEYDPVTKIFNVKAHLLAAETGKDANGSLVVYNNKLYAMTNGGGLYDKGVILEFDPAAALSGNLIKKYDFNGTQGAKPNFEMAVSGSKLYGMTYEGGANNKGVLFEFDPAGAPGNNYIKKVDFDGSGNGANPRGGLTLVSGTLYGTTTTGGAHSKGVIFSYTPGATSVAKKIDVNEVGYNEPIGNLVYTNGLLYGSGNAFFFSYDPTQPAGSGFTGIARFDYAVTGDGLQAGFSVAPSGVLYGLPWAGGESQGGTILKFDPAAAVNATNPTALFHINTSTSGYQGSSNGFTQFGGKLYGVTKLGAGNSGVVFELNPANAAYTETRFKTSSQGYFPSGRPVAGGNGKLYGTTQTANGVNWVLYEYDPVSHTITDKFAATGGVDGLNPQGAMVLASNGKLYGVASAGGYSNVGVIFEYDPLTNTFTRKIDLDPTFGQSHTAPLMIAPNGKIYGTSKMGGSQAKGVIFEYQPGATTLTKLYSFTGGVDGAQPDNIVLAMCTANGKLYGTTSAGGANGAGTIFEFTLPNPGAPNGIFTKKYDFTQATGTLPRGGLTESGNGKFYGMTTSAGGADKGVLFEYDPISNTFTKKTDLTGMSGYGTYNGAMTVMKDVQSIYNYAPIPDKPYGTVFSLSVPSTSGLPVMFRSSDNTVATVTGNTISVVGIGTATITAMQPGNGGYLPAPEVNQTLTTTKGNQVISFMPIAPKTTESENFDLSATASTALPITFASSNTSVATVNGSTVTIVGEGSTIISASVGESSLYFATTAYQTLVVNNANPKGQLWGMTSEGGNENGMGGGGVIFKTNADASSYMSVQKVFQFDSPGDRPQSMVMAPNGKFYGTTNYGGRYLSGVIFEYDPAVGTYAAVHHFQYSTGYLPNEGLMLASNGKLYGTTPYGGADGRGVIYEFDPATGTYHVMFTFLSSFGNQPRSGLIEAGNGKFYGTAPWGGSGIYGVIYEFNLATGTAVIRHNFTTATGSAPAGPVMQASNGKLYGMTQEGGANNVGVLYEYDLSTSTYTKHADLSQASGRTPYGGLTQSSANSKLYGLTQWGGANSDGTIVQFDPATGVFQSIVSLGLTLGGRPSYGFTEAPNGKLYCATNIRLLELDPITAGVTTRQDFPSEGVNSGGTLTKAYNGKLYGVSPVGLSGNRGTIFSFDYTANTYETKIDFNKATNGAYPLGSLVKANNGKLYGMVSKGGSDNLGFIFELDQATGVFTKKIDFTGPNGDRPSGGMSLGTNGKLYGMTTYGGSQGLGVLFEYDPASNTYTKKKDFTSPNGQYPTGDLTLASNGKFYGLLPTNFEVPSGYLFEYDPATDAFQSKITFNAGIDGKTPDGTLTQGGNGKLYGTTAAGGTNEGGVLFEYDPATNVYTKKADFSGSADLSESSIGTRPVGKLALTADGKLYGMTTYGGYKVNFNNTTGTIFAFDPATGVLTRKHRFGCASGACYVDGFNPRGSLVLAPDNKLYGMTSSGGQSSLYGVAFVFDPATAVYTKKFDFTQANGASPRSNTLIYLPGMMDQSITFGVPEGKTINDAAFNLSATASSGLPVTFVSSDPAVATISGNTVTIKSMGSTTITASQAGNADYNPAAVVERTLVISKAAQTISFTMIGIASFGDAPFTLQATSTSGLPITYTSTNPTVATVSGNTVTIVGPGTTTIKANQAGNDTFAAAGEVSQSLTIVKGAQIITFSQNLAKKFTEASLTFTATASSGLPVTYKSADAAIATISGNVVTFVSRGQVTITASQAGNGNYEAAADVTRTLTVENAAPAAAKTIARQEALQLMPFTFTFGADVFTDPENDLITYSAVREGTQSLPTWLAFNAQTRTFSGTPGMTDHTIDVQLKATDIFNASATVAFKIGIAVITSTETKPEQELYVYPNPVQNILVIQHRLPGETTGHVVIRSSLGSTVYENQPPGSRTEVDTAQWQPGVYLVEVRTDKAVRQTKIIKL